MPQWTDAAGKPSPFPTEAPPSSSIANFRKKEDALIGDLSGSIDAKNAAATEAVYTTKTTSELSITNQMELMKSLEGTGLSKSILSHQVAANTVHARELAALQLKYSTKNAELDAAHSTHEAFDAANNMAIAESLAAVDDARDLSGLRAQYNLLVQKVVASRSLHQRRVQEVLEAQEFEASGIRRERDALLKSLDEIEATYDASVRTLETQLLLLLRSKLEVQYKEQLESMKAKIAALERKRDDQTAALARLQEEYAALLRQLEDQQTQHAAHVAAAAREALAKQRAEMEAVLEQLRAEHEAAKQDLLDQLHALRLQQEADQRAHERLLADLRAQHEAELQMLREKHDHSIGMERETREANASSELDSMRRSHDDELAIDALGRELDDLNRTAPANRGSLENRHEQEMAQLKAEREAADEAREQKKKLEMEEAVNRAAEEARERARRELELQFPKTDGELDAMDLELERLRKQILAARARTKNAKHEEEDTIRALGEAHGSAMAGIMLDDEPDEKACSGVGDDLDDVRRMVRERREELVRADKQAALDELKADCASYADALAALQRALGAERNAHGSEVRRQQAELDAKESELALLRAEAASFVVVSKVTAANGSTTTTTKTSEVHASLGASLLTSATVDGDDPVMAEWRKLVQTEKSKFGATTVRAAPSVVDLDATNSRIASLTGDLSLSKKFIIEAEMKMLNSMAKVGAM
ncbi:hypothetical protein JL722_2286 [Aureococcus anophagefferens]|nr:hypothetical protein JL722_2286 [Aureococcus anophagefferens]